MLSNATNQPKSTVELGYLCPRGLSDPNDYTLNQSLNIAVTNALQCTSELMNYMSLFSGSGSFFLQKPCGIQNSPAQ